MQIIAGTTEFQIQERTAAAIGKFDGIHKGHQILLERLQKKKENGLKIAVFTFDPSPATFFSGKPEMVLTTKEEKRACFEKMGVDYLIEFPLNKETAAMTPEKFVEEILVQKMQVAYIAAGTDLSFGDKGRGNSELLQRMASEYHYEVEIVPKICLDEREISSTYVREEVMNGNMELVELLTGHFYQISGVVEHGRKLGSEMGIPTLNIVPETDKLLPPNGVYFSKALVDGREYRAITNIGKKPTVKDDKGINVETFVYDFAEDSYGKNVTIELLVFRRAEQKFSSVAELQENIKRDLNAGIEYFSK